MPLPSYLVEEILGLLLLGLLNLIARLALGDNPVDKAGLAFDVLFLASHELHFAPIRLWWNPQANAAVGTHQR